MFTDCKRELVCTEKRRNYQVEEIVAKLHTLLHGTFDIKILDFKCECDKKIYFDGRDLGLFCVLAQAAYKRELLDPWLCHVAMIGGNFREGYYLEMLLVHRAQVIAGWDGSLSAIGGKQVAHLVTFYRRL